MKHTLQDTVLLLMELNIILLSPLIIVLVNLSQNYRMLIYLTISGVIVIYVISDQFFRFSKQFPVIIRNTIGVSMVNLVFLGLLTLTGLFSSPFFFLVYIILLVAALATDERVTVIVTLTIIGYLLLIEFQLSESFENLAFSSSSAPLANLFSIFFVAPLAIAIASYFRRLREKESTLNELRLVLAEEETEDEILLEEVAEGIIVLDHDRKIVKISRSAERVLNLSARIALGEHFLSLVEFSDPVTYKPLGITSTFYKNLSTPKPRDLKWEVGFMDEYRKVTNLLIEQRPLYNTDNEVDGFLIFIHEKHERAVAEVVRSFNEFLFVRLSSLVSLITFARKNEKFQDRTDHYLDKFIETLNAANLYRRAELKSFSLVVNQFSLVNTIEALLKQFPGRIELMADKNLESSDQLMVETDERLLHTALFYLLKGAIYLGSEQKVAITARRDIVSRRVQIKIDVTSPKVESERYQFLPQPFFQGDVEMINIIGGTGLETAIAANLFAFMSIEFLQEVYPQSLSFVVTFKK